MAWLTDVARVPLRYHASTTPRRTTMSAGQGSTGNVIAAVCSFFIPGLGQLVQGRLLKAIIMFVLAAALWVLWLGWIIHLWSILDAALYKPQG
jgi:TM2 domain-containing membrane protein YozV